MDYFIGIDIGTSSVKCLALGPSGESIAVSRKAYPVIEDSSGRHEEDPELVCRSTLSSLKEVLALVPSGHKLRGICFSAAMHGLLALDADGKPLTPLITWADTRAGKATEEFKKTGLASDLYIHTGTPLHPMAPFCKLLWLQTDFPDLMAKATIFVSIKEYIWYRLFGVFEIDHSVASGTGLFDTRSERWYEGALEAAGIHTEQLSRPVPVTFTRWNLLEKVRAEYDLPQGVPFVIGAGDGCLANLGSGVVSQGEASLTIGTSGAIRVVTSRWSPDPEERLFQYVLEGQTYVKGGAINNGGNMLDWFRNLLETPGQKTQALATDVLLSEAFSIPEGSEGLLFLPYLYGERSPIWDAGARGAFVGLRAHHRRAHLLRAITEGIGYALTDIFRILDKDALTGPLHVVYASGGFTASEAWVQQLSDQIGRPVCLTGESDASAMGAVLIAMLAQGMLPSVKDARHHIRPGKIFRPRETEQDLYRRGFELYQSLYPSLSPTFKALNKLS